MSRRIGAHLRWSSNKETGGWIGYGESETPTWNRWDQQVVDTWLVWEVSLFFHAPFIYLAPQVPYWSVELLLVSTAPGESYPYWLSVHVILLIEYSPRHRGIYSGRLMMGWHPRRPFATLDKKERNETGICDICTGNGDGSLGDSCEGCSRRWKWPHCPRDSPRMCAHNVPWMHLFVRQKTDDGVLFRRRSLRCVLLSPSSLAYWIF